jgi:hypothetical protein
LAVDFLQTQLLQQEHQRREPVSSEMLVQSVRFVVDEVVQVVLMAQELGSLVRSFGRECVVVAEVVAPVVPEGLDLDLMDLQLDHGTSERRT